MGINRLGAMAAMLLWVAGSGIGMAKTAPEDGNGAYATGKYRNLFAEDGHSKKEIRRRSTRRTSSSFTVTSRRRRSRLTPAATPTVR